MPAPSTAVIVAHTANELEPLLSEGDRTRLAAAATDPRAHGATVLIVAAGRPGVDSVDLTPRRPNGQVEHGPRAPQLIQARLDAVQLAIRHAARESRSGDLLRALDTAARAGARDVVVLSAGISTNDPLDMRVLGWNADPRAVAHDLADRHLLPELRGIDVEFSGLGRTTGAQAALGPREQEWLHDLWLAVCAEAGGSCTADDSPRPANPPVSGRAVPPVAIPQVTTTPGPDNTETVTVPTDLLFGPDSCTLLDPARALDALAPLIAQLRTGRYQVAVSGRTAPVGDAGIPLATCRARVAAALLPVAPQLITAIRGDGSLLDPPGAGLGPDGQPDPNKLAALRRVVFTLTRQEHMP